MSLPNSRRQLKKEDNSGKMQLVLERNCGKTLMLGK
jgi:hypothetical protein